MRKLLMLAAMVSAALLLTAAPAVALDHPFEDTDPAHWAKAQIMHATTSEPCGNPGTNCEFEASTESGDYDGWRWEMLLNGNWEFCSASIEGSISDNGTVTVTNMDTAHRAGWMGMCDNDAVNLPWTGKVCYHVPSGTAWLAQHMSFDHVSLGNLLTFATFPSTPTTDEILFGSSSGAVPFYQTQLENYGSFHKTSGDEVLVEESSDPCTAFPWLGA
jgi:hypothetical protein